MSGRTRLAVTAIAAAALLGLTLRGAPLAESCSSEPISYDEGVYVSSGMLLSEGALPYRDFVFVHPPGAALLLAPLGLLDGTTAVCAGRIVSVAAGVLAIALVGLVALKAFGPSGGAAAAAACALFPVGLREHRVLLEPGLTLLSVSSLAALAYAARAGPRRLLAPAAGALGAVALSYKLWAFAPIAAVLLAESLAGTWKTRPYLAALAATSAVLWLPFLVLTGTDLVEQVVTFQLERPADGLGERDARLRELIGDYRSLGGFVLSQQAPFTVVAAIGAALAVGRRLHGVAGAATLWTLGAGAAFLVSGSFYGHYVAFLAAPVALLAGAAVSAATSRLRPAVVALASVALLGGVGASLLEGRELGPRPDQRETTELRALFRSHVPPAAPVFSFEPGWLLAGRGAPPREVVDTYAAMLLDRVARGSARTAAAAFASQPYSTPMFERLRRHDYLLLGSRGRRQLTAAQLSWVSGAYDRVAVTGSEVDLWARRGARGQPSR